jgi:hypothetical protein
MQSFGQDSVDRDQILAAQVEEERQKLSLSLMNPSMNYANFHQEILRSKDEFEKSEVSSLSLSLSLSLCVLTSVS